MMKATAPDFTALTAGELAIFAVAHQAELGLSGLVEADITEAIAAGHVSLELRPYGFAIIEQKGAANGAIIPHLWLLFVSPGHRSKGLGSSFMRDLLRQHSPDHPMSLFCVGSRRCAFFGRLSFKIESQDGDVRRMTYVGGCHQDWHEYLDEWLALDTWNVGDALLLLAGIFPVEAEILETDDFSPRYGVVEAPVVVRAGLLDLDCNAKFSDNYERLLILAGQRLRIIRAQWRSGSHSAERYAPTYFMTWAQTKKLAPSWLEAKQIQIAAERQCILSVPPIRANDQGLQMPDGPQIEGEVVALPMGLSPELDKSQERALTPKERRSSHDFSTMRGAPRRILEKWDDIESLYGQKVNATQVLKVLNRDKDEKQPVRKTIQNHLITLRKQGLIP